MTAMQGPEPREYCGAKKRQGAGTCRLRAGWATDHVGFGRCKLHGGATPATVGKGPLARYRLGQRLGDLVEEFRDDPDPLNVLEEIALLRALLQEWVEKAGERACEECGSPGRTAGAASLIDRVSKVVSRVERARAVDAISRPELRDLLGAIGSIIRHHVRDEATLERIERDWYDLTVRSGRRGRA